MADGSDASRPTGVDPAVVVAGQVCLTGMEPHADPDLPAVGPRSGVQGTLAVDGRPDRRSGLGEGREERIALRADGDTAVSVHRIAQEPQVDRVDLVPRRPE